MSYVKRATGKGVRLTAALWHQPPVGDLKAAAASLRAEIDAMASSPATFVWSELCEELVESVAKRNPVEFLQWPVILKTMNTQGPEYVELEFRYLRSHPEWRRRKSVLQESIVGRNDPYWLYPWTSGNSIHHYYHLQRFSDQWGVDLASFSRICEFGGGYGNLCRIVRRTGFAGEYVIIDLPQVHALQRFYLHTTGTKATLLPPSEALSWLGRTDLENALFIATWSFSESPIVVREPIAKFLPQFRGHLIAFQRNHAGIDNVAYFRDLAKSLAPTHQCMTVEIEHLPGNFYFFTLRK